MQDSLEDYLRISKNAKETETVRISKEIQATAQRKKDCDARAMKIVEFSIEGKLRPEVFTKCLPFITQEHYQDIVEERAITKLCGYPACGKKIPEMPNKQYFISTKSNKVYDITERKNFCSNFCYKASLHIKRQIDNSPLWLRKLEDIPEYSLLNSSDEGLPGEYIDQGLIKPPPIREQYFTSISSFTQASLDDLTDREIKAGKSKRDRPKHVKKYSRLKSTMQTIKENETEVQEEEIMVCVSKSEVKAKTHKKTACVVNLPAIEENEEKAEQRDAEESTKEETKKNKKKVTRIKLEVESIVRRAFEDWLTLETCIFIHGEENVKAILDEQKLSAYFETLKVIELQQEQQKRYMDVCRRLQLQEMADEKFDNAVTGDVKLRPLPDYKQLKEQSKDMRLKVKSFFEGGLYEKKDTNYPQQQISSKNGDGEEEVPTVLPPVDANSRNLMRRKIFLSSLNKAMHQLLQSLGVTYFSSTLSDVQSLVKTFRLSADNITFKPVIWNYIAVVLLHLLSLKDQSVKSILEEKGSEEYIKLVTSPHNINNFLEEILSNVKNVEVFVQHYITSKKNM